MAAFAIALTASQATGRPAKVVKDGVVVPEDGAATRDDSCRPMFPEPIAMRVHCQVPRTDRPEEPKSPKPE